MAVALAEPQAPSPDNRPRGDIRQARERIRFKPSLLTEERRSQYVGDFHAVILSSAATDRDKKNYLETFKLQDKMSKLYIGQILLEKLEDQVRSGQGEKSIQAFLKVADMIDLPGQCSIDKAEEKDIKGLLKELNKIYDKGGKLGLGVKVALGLGAAGTMFGGSEPAVRQTAIEMANVASTAATSLIRQETPHNVFESVVDASNQDGGARIPAAELRPAPQPRIDIKPTDAPPPEVPYHQREEDLTYEREVDLVPHPIRILQNPELNRLYKEGCVDFKEVKIGDKEVMVLDYMPKPGVKCDIKFPQAYTSPASARVRTYEQVDRKDLGVTLEQFNATCAINSLVIASLFVNRDAGPKQFVVNPLLLAEVEKSLTPEVFSQLKRDVLNSPAFTNLYSMDLVRTFAETTPINDYLQRPEIARRVFKSVFGDELKRSSGLKYPEIIPGTTNASFDKQMFSSLEWQELSKKYNFSSDPNSSTVTIPLSEAGKVHGEWIEKWYQNLTSTASSQNKNVAPIFSLRFNESNITHMYVATGVETKGDRKYFRMTEGLSGYLFSYMSEKGAIKNPDGSVSIPLDKMWEIGVTETFIMSGDKKPAISTLAFDGTPPPDIAPVDIQRSPAETIRSSERREALVSNQFGFRVNSVEAIEKLPSSIGTIRIAGNDTNVGADGRIENQDNVYFFENMLEAADKRGLKVVFVLNPKWLPGVTNSNLTEADLQKSREIVEKQVQAILKHPSVSHIEVGNEIDENKPNSTVRFWRGNMSDYAKFFKIVTDSVQKVDRSTGRNTEMILSSFADPTGVRNPTEKNYAELAQALRDNGLDMSKFLVAGHAYHLDQLQWIVANLQKRMGAKGVILTEVNVGRNDQPAQKEFEEMMALAKKSGITTLIHEWKPEMPHDIDYGGGRLALDEKDPRTHVVIGLAAEEIRQRQALAQNVQNNN